jgi:sugar O-acyltransferase (sialic acid O-acetyltransferase NeuD family)
VVTSLIVIGAGGHAKVLLDLLSVLGRTVLGLTDRDNARTGEIMLGVPILGDDAILAAHDKNQVALVNAIGSTGSTVTRAAIFRVLAGRGFRFETLLHPTSCLSRHATVGEGVQVMAGAIVQTSACIGANVIINSGAIVEHDCEVGAHCHLAPGAILSGGVVLEEGVHIGAGAVVRQGIRIGANAIVASGAAVVRDIASGQTVKGVPAR